jgi:hypothetical protein
MAQQSLIAPDIAAVEDCGLIGEYQGWVSETTAGVRPIPAIDPPDYEVIEINSHAQ